jgi:DNA-binding transcriptional ArsR family regulator
VEAWVTSDDPGCEADDSRCGDGPSAADDTGAREGESVPLSLDAILLLLADGRRQAILNYLSEWSDESASLDELIGHLEIREAERRDRRPARGNIEVEILHVHLPKLADAGVVEYDERSRQVRYWGNDRLERWLERTESEGA